MRTRLPLVPNLEPFGTAQDIGAGCRERGFSGAAQAVRRTLAWYREQRDGASARALCEAEIPAYEETA